MYDAPVLHDSVIMRLIISNGWALLYHHNLRHGHPWSGRSLWLGCWSANYFDWSIRGSFSALVPFPPRLPVWLGWALMGFIIIWGMVTHFWAFLGDLVVDLPIILIDHYERLLFGSGTDPPRVPLWLVELWWYHHNFRYGHPFPGFSWWRGCWSPNNFDWSIRGSFSAVVPFPLGYHWDWLSFNGIITIWGMVTQSWAFLVIWLMISQ